MLYQLFEQQVNLYANAVALVYRDESISYQALHNRVNILSGILASNAPQAAVVGVSASRSVNSIVGLLAVLKAGKAYLPLDPSYPIERLKQIIADSGITAILAEEQEEALFDSMGLKVINPATPSPTSAENLRADLAYVLYTSGSTGKPKGVAMGSSALVNLLQWQQNNSLSAPGFNTLQYAPLTFDVSFQEIFATLTTGGTLFLIDDDTRLDPAELWNFINRCQINRVFLPFVALQYLAEAADTGQPAASSLTEVMTAGEQLKITPQIARFFTALPRCTLYNQYGPTESHVVTQLELTGPPRQWPALPAIGKAITGAEIYILNENLQPVQPGQSGELYIGGICLANGYLNRPDLTAARFILWEQAPGKTRRIYQSGDIARLTDNGDIEYLGRTDSQVKIRGNRVEPAEIEVLLNQSPLVKQAVVVAREYQGGNKRLIAYLISAGKEDTAGIKNYIGGLVPDYMLPSAFIWIKEFPKTTSGKVNRNALPLPVLQRPDTSVLYHAPVTLMQKRLSGLWAEMLQMDKVGIDDNFFDLGGNSLLAINTATQLRSQFNIALPVTKIYQHPTINAIAGYLDGTPGTELRLSKKRGQPGGDIAIIAMAGKWPGAANVQEFWDVLQSGQETTSFFTTDELDASIPPEIKDHPAYVKARGVLADPGAFDAGFFNIAPRLAEMMDPQQRVFLEIAWEALEASGYQPQHYDGLIGVYAGSNNNTYYYNNVLTNPALVEQAGAFQVMTLNEKDYVASRTAYELNLKGPAVSVYSACSTSLLAVAQAVDALRSGQCDMALAGGVTISAPVKSGHIYQEGAMLSNDGHTRPFDASATGTVFSDGAGIVVLKPLAAAQQDGDTIFAIIKGKAVNNDGNTKGSFTAPNAAGQASVIASALQDAGVDASAVSYVEAHGTATPLGDPIELDGLKMAFGLQAEQQYCAIGSVKSNMGHLTAASGVTGLIKTALCLHNRQLVPSLFYQEPNPAINFSDSPFYVNSTLKTWESEVARTAGVSSFGVGGTNVHVILQEAGHPEMSSGPGRPLQLITWSAKSQSSLDNYALKLTEKLQHDIADVAYSLQTTRAGFNYRRFEVAGSYAGLTEQLQRTNASHQKNLKEKATEVVWLFPGQGSQYAGMGRELYENERIFKQAMNECAAIIQKHTGTDILQTMYGAQGIANLTRSEYIQPALFAIEYALAKLWLSWGIKPAAFLGHSLGEFVAAHLAGIMGLEDALLLVTARAELIAALPAGKMLAVRLSAPELEKILPHQLNVAAINGPNLTVVSGPVKAIDAFAALLSEQGKASMLLNTSHAMHSAMVDDIIAPFKKVVQGIQLSAPRIPLVSGVTGKWLSEAQATDPAYWAAHMRHTIEFTQALQTANDEPNRVLLECGPGSVLATLAKSQANKAEQQIILPGITENTSACAAMLNNLGQLWLNGLEPDWQAFYAGQQRARVLLPSYSFNHKQYWLKPGNPLAVVDAVNNTILPLSPAATVAENHPPIMRHDTLSTTIRKIFEGASGIVMDDVPADMTFAEAGFDSLLLTQIALNLKKEFSIPVTFRKLYEEYNTVELLARFLDMHLPPSAYQNVPTATQALPADQSQLNVIAQQVQLLSQQLTLMQKGGSQVNHAQQLISPLKPDTEFTAEELVEIKKPFGATARIERQSLELTDKQQQFLQTLTKNYNAKTPGSKNYTQQYREGMADPRVVTGFRPQTKEVVYPIVVNRSGGSRVWDIDGNEYIDALNGFGSNFLGYNPDFLKQVFQQQIEEGYEIGPQHPLAGEVCQLINEFTGFERSALCNTGSEAVLGAMRMARTVTGKSLIVAFAGSYHGIIDEVIVRGSKQLRSVPAAPGILPEAVQNMLILDYGTDESLAIIKQRSADIAAVLVEPVQSRRPEFQPIAFLKQLREITREAEIALVFDEVITGFRMHPGGAQAMFGIKADIGTYGKVIGGGMPIGVIAGIPLYMDALDGGNWQFGDKSVPEGGVTYFAGTFVRHPLALAGAKAVLNYLKQEGPSLQQGINSLARQLAERLNAICDKHQLPVYIAQFGSLWKIKFKYEMAYGELLFTLMRHKGIHIWDIFPCFLTAAHKQADVDAIVSCFEESVDEMIEAGFFTSRYHLSNESKLSAFNKAPVANARLGRDKEGNPAWFVPDKDNPGKYLQLENK